MTLHSPLWITPAPLWLDPESVLERPTLLRFATDRFMDDLLEVLDKDPQGLRALQAVPETWRGVIKPQTDPLPEPKIQSTAERKLSRLAVARDRGKQGWFSKPKGDDRLAHLKLYQPIQQRYYLVTANLVCQALGFPDRVIDSGRNERAGFVIRRLVPPPDPTMTGIPLGEQPLPDSLPATWNEYAYLQTPQGSGWQQVSNSSDQTLRKLVTGEELLPLFPMTYCEDDGRRRRLLAGLIPVGRREVYVSAPPRQAEAAGEQKVNPYPKTARVALFQAMVVEPWKNIVTRAYRLKESGRTDQAKEGDRPSESQQKDSLKIAREQLQLASWYVLLDFAEYLKDQFPPAFWKAVVDPGSDLNDGKLKELHKTLGEIPFSSSSPIGLETAACKLAGSLRDALLQVDKWRKELEKITSSYNRDKPAGWPNFLFPLADIQDFGKDKAIVVGPKFNTNPTRLPDHMSDVDPIIKPLPPAIDHLFPADTDDLQKKGLKDLLLTPDYLTALIEYALPDEPEALEPAIPLAAQPVLDPREAWFLIRCVYERPRCGLLNPAEVSEPTEPFQMAGFFDPDAPARPLRIGLPIDTTPAGLRKFDKNAVFMISDVLCGQIKRVKGITFGDLVLSVLPWPFHKDLPSFTETGPCKKGDNPLGMMCSLSIPIITLCALILMIIMVSLLDIIFHWLPWLIFCFPIPGFRGKK